MDHWSDGEAQAQSRSNTTISDTAVSATRMSEVDLVPPSASKSATSVHLGTGLIPEPFSRHSNLHLGSGFIPEPVSQCSLGSGLIPEPFPQRSNTHLGSGIILEQPGNEHLSSELVPHPLSQQHSDLHRSSSVLLPDPATLQSESNSPPSRLGSSANLLKDRSRQVLSRSSQHLIASDTGLDLPQWSSGHLPAPVTESGLLRQSSVDLLPVGSHAQLVKKAESEGGTSEGKTYSDGRGHSLSDANYSQATLRLANESGN